MSFTSEKHMELEYFHMRNFYFIHEIETFSRVKQLSSKFNMRNIGVHVKINFTYEIFTSHMKLKQLTRETLLSYVKWQVKFLEGLSGHGTNATFQAETKHFSTAAKVKHYYCLKYSKGILKNYNS